MREINISVTKAQIKGFQVQLDNDEPQVTASIALLTEGGREIANYTLSTNHWKEESKFDLPVRLVAPIVDIMAELEKVVVTHCNNSQLSLTAPKHVDA
jgi:hypothetical protein